MASSFDHAVTTGILFAARSETGSRSRNEDRLQHGQSAQGWFAVLADGAGGHSRGDEAASRAVQDLAQTLGADATAFNGQVLTDAVLAAHARVSDDSEAVAVQRRMHSTVVVLWLDAAGQRALWSHVGDSRLYRIRHGRCERLTADDSVVDRLEQAGLISADQAHNHPQKNQLLAALGMEGEVSPHTLAVPAEVLEGDAYLLCSDGWWDHFDTTTLAASLAAAATPQAWLDAMAAQVAQRQRPRQDNYSAVAVWVGDPGEVTRPR